MRTSKVVGMIVLLRLWTAKRRPPKSAGALELGRFSRPRAQVRHRAGWRPRLRIHQNRDDVRRGLPWPRVRKGVAVEISVQWIKTSWTKRSRGGEPAARRNAAPIGFQLRQMPPSVAHFIRMSEQDGFEPHESELDLDKVGLNLRDEGGTLRVIARVEPLFGLPPRPRRPPSVRLAPGQWARWQLNYRFSSAAGVQDWSYWLDTFNIAYGPVSRDAFLSDPTVLVDECGPVR